MRRIIALILCFLLILSGCTPQNGSESSNAIKTTESNLVIRDEEVDFQDLSDPDLLSYVEEEVYSQLIDQLDSDEYFIENVQAVYVSQEYIDELTYNSQENTYFGYKISDVEKEFQGAKYVFTLGEDGQTVVKEFENYDDTYEKIIKNVAIGSGVIIVCVVVSVVAGAVEAPAISMFFAASAETGTKFAVSSGVIGGVMSGAVTGIETKDGKAALKSAALSASDGFKWGAITGSIAGGSKAVIQLKGATLNGLTMHEAALIQKESKFSLNVIKNFESMEQYKICKKAGLVETKINGKNVLLRKINLKHVDEFGKTNLERIKLGKAPLAYDRDAKEWMTCELHHLGQKKDSPLLVLTEAEHRLGENYNLWHHAVEKSEIDRAAFDKIRKAIWKDVAEKYMSGVLK